MSKNKTKLYIALAAIFAVFTVLSFAIPFAHNAAFWISYLFAVIAIAIQAFCYPRAFDFDGNDARSRFYGFPLARLSTIYLAAQLGLSLLFMIVFTFLKMGVWIPAGLYVVLLGVFAIGFIAADSVKEEIERQDATLKKNVSTMRSLQSIGRNLASLCEDKELRNELEQLSDELRYSDPVSCEETAAIESQLSNLLDELRSVLPQDRKRASSLCKKARSVLGERNRICKLNKR